jgi:hypothetical protein
MRVRRVSSPFIAFVILFLFTACATAPTKFTTVSKDEAYQEHPRKVLVVNASKNPGTRRLFEDELSKALKDRGIDAVVSYTTMPDQMVSDKNAIAAQANAVDNMPDPIVSDKNTIAAQAYAVGADTVLISKPRGSEINEITGSRETGAYYEDLYINTQTEVYDMKSNRSVLTVLARTWIRKGEPADKIIRSYIKDLMNELLRMGLF